MMVDQKTERVIVPLNTQLEASGKLELANSESWIKLVLRLAADHALQRLSQRDGCPRGDDLSLWT
jgi:hypothetical protein